MQVLGNKDVFENCLIRVVDDDDAFNTALGTLLEYKGFEVLLYPSAAAFLSKDIIGRPGCILLDVRMPGMSGLELQERLLQMEAKLPIIFLTAHGDIDMAVDSLHAGAFDFLQKGTNTEKLLNSVFRACQISLRQTFPYRYLTEHEAAEIASFLSDRELEIMKLSSLGLPNTAIGERLGISPRSVDSHRLSARKKTKAQSSEDLIQILRIAGYL